MTAIRLPDKLRTIGIKFRNKFRSTEFELPGKCRSIAITVPYKFGLTIITLPGKVRSTIPPPDKYRWIEVILQTNPG